MAAENRTEQLPLFPLAEVALFPHTRLPLLAFEPRYRQLTAHALEESRRIGMVAVLPEHAEDLSGDPPLYTVGCAGEITSAERLRDGRYRFVLVGTRRFRILREEPRRPERLYRVAEVELLPEGSRPEERDRIAALRAGVVELVADLLRQGRGGDRGGAEKLAARLSDLDDATFTDALCQALTFSTPEKQGLLEAEGVSARLEHLAGLLRFRLAELTGRVTAGSRTLH